MKKTLLLFSILFGFYSNAQIKTASTVSLMMVSPSTTVTNTTAETEIFRDTIVGKTLMPGRDYRLEAHFNITTPAISLPTITVRIYIGSTTITVVNASLLVGSLTSAPFIVFSDMVTRTTSTEIFTANQIQPTGSITSLSFSNTTFRQTLSEDMTADKVVRITVQLGGTVSASTIVATDWILRRIF